MSQQSEASKSADAEMSHIFATTFLVFAVQRLAPVVAPFALALPGLGALGCSTLAAVKLDGSLAQIALLKLTKGKGYLLVIALSGRLADTLRLC